MLTSSLEQQALRDVSDLETVLRSVEDHLSHLGQALQAQDPDATEAAAQGLHLALSRAMRRFGESAARGAVPLALRRRLALASGQVAAQREAVARATTLLDRAIDVLLPSPASQAGSAGLYGAHGGAMRHQHTGYTQA